MAEEKMTKKNTQKSDKAKAKSTKTPSKNLKTAQGEENLKEPKSANKAIESNKNSTNTEFKNAAEIESSANSDDLKSTKPKEPVQKEPRLLDLMPSKIADFPRLNKPTTKPKVSILVPSYNHERFVREFLFSLLRQEFLEYEICFVDDCSSDKTYEVANEFVENFGGRLKMIKHERNMGLNAALNTAFAASRGEVILFLASDDALALSGSLGGMLTEFEAQKEAQVMYSVLCMIDENSYFLNRIRAEQEGYKEFLFSEFLSEQEPLSRANALRYAFFKKNPFVSPAMMVRRAAFSSIMPLNCGLCNLQDETIHIELLSKYEYYCSPNCYTFYRISSTQLSSRTGAIRCTFERASSMDSFLKITDCNLLAEIFSAQIAKCGLVPFPDTIEFFLGFMAACFCEEEVRKFWGYTHMVNAFNRSARGKNEIYRRYKFDFKALLALIKA